MECYRHQQSDSSSDTVSAMDAMDLAYSITDAMPSVHMRYQSWDAARNSSFPTLVSKSNSNRSSLTLRQLCSSAAREEIVSVHIRPSGTGERSIKSALLVSYPNASSSSEALASASTAEPAIRRAGIHRFVSSRRQLDHHSPNIWFSTRDEINLKAAVDAGRFNSL